MSWFRMSAVIFGVWGTVFFLFPTLTNEFGGIGFTGSQHAKDWTQLVGLFSFSFAFLLEATHRSENAELRRIAARMALVVTAPSALLMTYWQIVPNRQWLRLDIINILLLALMSYGLVLHSGLLATRQARSLRA